MDEFVISEYIVQPEAQTSERESIAEYPDEFLWPSSSEHLNGEYPVDEADLEPENSEEEMLTGNTSDDDQDVEFPERTNSDEEMVTEITGDTGDDDQDLLTPSHEIQASEYYNQDPQPKSSAPREKRQRVKTGIIYECDVCEKKFQYESSLQIHKRFHSGEKLSQCNECGKRFATQYALKRHSRTHEQTQASVCETCNASFMDQGDFARHTRFHETGEAPYTCKHCGDTFDTYSAIKAHRSRKHRSQWQCKHCWESFPTEKLYREHRVTHETYSCSQCNMKFMTQEMLEMHEEEAGEHRPPPNLLQMSKEVTESSASSMNPGVKQPDPLKVELGAEMHITWKHWENSFSWYSKAIQLNKSPKEVQAAVLMTVIGPDVTDIFESFNLSESEKGDMNIILKKFREYFSPKCNEIYESYQFFLMRQNPDEKFHDFLVRVRVQIKKCNYASGVVDRLIRDKIVSGLSSERLKEKLLAADNPSLNETIKVCQAYEQASRQMRKMNSEKTENEIAAVEKSGDSKSAKSKAKSKTQDVFDCSRCLTKHGSRKCPAFNKKCPNCGYRGHVKEACRSRRKVQKVSQEDEEDEDESSDEAEVEELKIFSVTGKHSSDWTEELQYQNKKFRVKIDTGAECCVLPMKILKRLGVEKVTKTGVKRLISYDGGSIDVVGKVRLQCLVRGKPIKVVFQVINKDCTPVIDGDTSTRAKIIQRVSSVREDIFQGLGCVKDFVYDVDLCDNPKWQIHKPRTIPHSARDDVKAEIDKMVHMKVIQPCTEPREMVSPLVINIRKQEIHEVGLYKGFLAAKSVRKDIKDSHLHNSLGKI
uniref:C2H2-type domain-containing protein n=1 Tax=Phlebotomus papatasi TaxID=29031 RepID=A0A1B0D597_PHLPP